MAKIIVLTNQKGGVGKTVTTCNFGAALALEGKRVLIIDADYQGNTSSALGVKQLAISENRTISNGMIEGTSIKDLIYKTEIDGLDVVASDMDFGELNTQYIGKPGSHLLLKEWIEPILSVYDLIVIDTHPSLDLTFQNVMTAADYYIIPLFAEPDSVDGLHIMFSRLNEIQARLNPRLKNLGCIITKFKKKNTTHQKFLVKLSEFASKVGLAQRGFKILEVVPDSDAVASSSDEQVPVVISRPHLPVSKAYIRFTQEVLNNLTDKRGRPKAPITVKREDVRSFMKEFETSNGFKPQRQVRF